MSNAVWPMLAAERAARHRCPPRSARPPWPPRRPLVTGDTPPLVGTFQEQAWKTVAPAPRTTWIDIRLANVVAATLQLGRAGFGVGEHGTVVVHSDGGTSLTITGLAAGEQVSRGAAVIAYADASGSAQVALAVGNTTLMLG